MVITTDSTTSGAALIRQALLERHRYRQLGNTARQLGIDLAVLELFVFEAGMLTPALLQALACDVPWSGQL